MKDHRMSKAKIQREHKMRLYSLNANMRSDRCYCEMNIPGANTVSAYYMHVREPYCTSHARMQHFASSADSSAWSASAQFLLIAGQAQNVCVLEIGINQLFLPS